MKCSGEQQIQAAADREEAWSQEADREEYEQARGESIMDLIASIKRLSDETLENQIET